MPELIIKDNEIQIIECKKIIWKHPVKPGEYAKVFKMAQQILHALD